MLENFYALAPTLTTDEHVSSPTYMIQPPNPNDDFIELPTDVGLKNFFWLRSHNIHAVAKYDDQIVVPFVWIGLWGLSSAWQNADEQRHVAGLDYWRWNCYSGAPQFDNIHPSAWAIVAADGWAMQQVGHVMDPDWPKAIFVDGNQLMSCQLAPSDIIIKDLQPLGTVGVPERLVRWVENNPVVAALNGKLAFRAAMLVEQWPAAKVADIAQSCGESKSKTRKVLRRLVDAKVLAEFDRHYYLGDAGIKAAARRDRVSPKTVRRRFGRFIGESDHSRKQYRIHDRRLLQMVNVWASWKLSVAAGWRHEVIVPGVVTLAPDAMLYILGDRNAGDWHYLEYERSATTPGGIARKLEGYRTFAEAGFPLPLVVVCDREGVERRFWDVGEGLDLLTSTYDRVLKSGHPIDQLTFNRFGRGEDLRVGRFGGPFGCRGRASFTSGSARWPRR